MRVVIHLFGPFRVTVDGEPIDEARWERKKSKTLLKVLALQPLRQNARQMHREELIELLWPDMNPDQGLNSFHKALHSARRALEPGLTSGAASRFLQTRDQMLALIQNDEISVDVTQFETLAEDALKTSSRDRLEAALALCQSDLLPEDRYEDWVVLRREQLQNRKELLLQRLATICEATGDLNAAIQASQQAIALNPVDETAHRGLMRLYAAQGQRHLAVQQFRTFSEILTRELSVSPEPETTRLYEQILAGTPTPALTPTPTPQPLQQPRNSPTPAHPPKTRRLLPLVATALLLASLAALYFFSTAKPLHSIAVMPLAAPAELDYVAEGITESVINELSHLPQLRVMARTTVYRYRARGTDPMAAAAEMKVDALLTGTLSKSGSTLTLETELVGVPDGRRLWGNRFSLNPRELISVQDRISSEIASGMRLQLTGTDRANLSPPHPTDAEAYRLYVQARYFWNQRSREGYLKSISLYQSAIERDPTYARAYAGLSDSFSFLGRDEEPTSQYMPKAKAAAQRALALDNNLSEAHGSLGMMSNVWEWNFPAAEQEFRKSLALDPNYATTHLFYGVFLASQGRLKESQVELDKAAELDPLSPIIALCRGYPENFAGHIEPAIRAARESLQISPGFESGHEDLMIYLERQGKQEPAMQNAVALLHARGQHELAEQVHSAYRQSGYQAAVRTWFEAEDHRASQIYVSPLRLAILAMRAGNMDKAFSWLDKAVEERNAGLVYLGIDPKYDRLRADPRFPAVCARVGIKIQR